MIDQKATITLQKKIPGVRVKSATRSYLSKTDEWHWKAIVATSKKVDIKKLPLAVVYGSTKEKTLVTASLINDDHDSYEIQKLPTQEWQEGPDNKSIIVYVKDHNGKSVKTTDFEWAFLMEPTWLEISPSGMIQTSKGVSAPFGSYQFYVTAKHKITKQWTEQSVHISVSTSTNTPRLKGNSGQHVSITLPANQHNTFSYIPEILNPIKGVGLGYTLLTVENADWIQWDSFTGELSGTPTNTSPTKAQLIVDNMSKHKLSISITINTTPTEVTENAPIISKVPENLIINTGTIFEFQVEVSNPTENAPLTFELINKQHKLYWLDIDEKTGLLSGTPEFAWPIQGTIQVTNNLGVKVPKDFSLDVQAPQFKLNGLPLKSASQGEWYDAKLNIENPTDDKVQVELQLQSKEAWLILDPQTNTLHGVPTDATPTIGNIVITNKYGTLSSPFNIEVTPHVGNAPQIQTNSVLNAVVGKEFSKSIKTVGDDTQKSPTKIKVSLSPDDQIYYYSDTKSLNGTPKKIGDIQGKIFATNEFGTSTKEFTINITTKAQDTKLAPIVDGNIYIYATERLGIKHRLDITNPPGVDPDDIKITITQEPPFKLKINQSTKTLSGIPTTEGEYYAKLKVDNGKGTSYIHVSIIVLEKEGIKPLKFDDGKKNIREKSKVIKSREKILAKAMLSGNPFLLLTMPALETPNYPKQVLDWGKTSLEDMKTNLGMWTVDRLDQYVAIPFKEWGSVHIKKPVKKVGRKINKSIKDKVISTARDRDSSFRGIFVFRGKIRKHKRKGGSGLFFVLSQMVKSALVGVGKIAIKAKQIARSIPGAKRLINAIGNTTTGEWITTTSGKASASFKKAIDFIDDAGEFENKLGKGLQKFGNKIIRTYRGVGDNIIVPVKTFTGNVITTISRTVNLVGHAASFRSFGTGSTAAMAAFIASGGNPIVALAAGAGGMAVGTYNNFIATAKQADFIFDATGKGFGVNINNSISTFLSENGLGQYKFNNLFNASDTARNEILENLTKNKSNVYTTKATIGRSLGAGIIVGSIGMMLAPVLGISAVVAGAVGAGVGIAGQVAYDKIAGPLKGKLIEKLGKQLGSGATTNLTVMASFPMTAFVNQVQGNFWLLNELDTLYNKYGGNWERYLKNNWTSKNPLMLIKNLLGGGFGALGSWQFVKSIAANLIPAVMERFFGIKMLSKLGAGFSASVMVGGLIGTVAGFALASMLGIPMGAGAIMGMAIGSAVGMITGGIASAYVSIQSGGLLVGTTIAITTATTTLFTTIGAAIGSLFDKSLRSLTEGIMGTVNALQAMLALGRLWSGQINANNAVMFVLSTVSLVAMIDKGVDDTGTSDTVAQENAGTTTAIGPQDINQLNLAHYNITLLDSNNDTWDQLKVTRLLDILKTLEQNGVQLGSLDKQVFLTLGDPTVYEGEKFILVSLHSDSFYRLEYKELLLQELHAINILNVNEDTLSLSN